MERLKLTTHTYGLPYAAEVHIDAFYSSTASEAIADGPCCLGMTWAGAQQAFDGWEV